MSTITRHLKRKDLFQTKAFIAGSFVDAFDGATFEVHNPASLGHIATVPEMGVVDTKKAIAAANEAFKSYRKTSARERARWLRRWNPLCLENLDDLALILTMENGKPLAEARNEVLYATSFLEWFAGEVIPTANRNQRVLTIKEPIGVAACLAPWNFPIAMITRKVGAALAAGCTTVWKPAGETPLSALAQALLAKEAGFPTGTINVITTLAKVEEVADVFCSSKFVRKISFTGSTRVGQVLAQKCSTNLTKLSLELGGNSPFIVFNDGKIETAVEACILAKFRNSGQMCVTANRIFVQRGIYQQFMQALISRIKTLKVGDGMDNDVFIGPLTHQRAVGKALEHIEDAKNHGATVELGRASFQPEGRNGYFIQPTVISGMSTKSLTTREETFAPVVGLYPFDTEEEVIEKANDCDVGLGSFIMTESMPRVWRVAESLEVGMVGVSLGMLSACESPFGGVKQSGYGREGGRQGIEEYLTLKSILINVNN
ncbi:succinate-semialdehyde dehydrogenase [Aspergillus parasiticus]|uniref:succinate-semialdehyde dehydrogenase [NAD(P)(+)] n=1 Tax=Aspergillus parasiticus TaxID=5067 RepID=A0A5N6D5T1_ASPPA|nr:succinate-semialdehyde dehydrogenase [Aspergillus parasiticus]